MAVRLFVYGLMVSSIAVLAACSSSEASTTSAVPATAPDVVASPIAPAASKPEMLVHKSPTCGCCQAWVDYVARAGFSVKTVNQDNMGAIKKEHGLHNPALVSCHTAIIDGYIIEGHVPVGDIERLLKERPDVVGLTAPGMPQMSPGMASEIPQNYDVLSFDKSGNSTIFSSY